MARPLRSGRLAIREESPDPLSLPWSGGPTTAPAHANAQTPPAEARTPISTDLLAVGSEASEQLQLQLPPPTPLTPSAKKAMAPRGSSKKKSRTPRKSKWNADNILSDPKSPLAGADLRSVLSNPAAWDMLSDEEKQQVVELFPDKGHVIEVEEGGKSEQRPNFATLLNDDTFRRDCAAYSRDVADGKHDVDWLAQAWAAHERRRAGDFDDFLAREFVNDWGIEGPAQSVSVEPMGPASSDEKQASLPGHEVVDEGEVIARATKKPRTSSDPASDDGGEGVINVANGSSLEK